ncbi:MAG: response regulator transcription factor [Chitinophagales bacterium]|nr:response regulator transcription factor [Chitinophagales bacterium]
MEKQKTVLIAEDDLQLGFLIKENLEEEGYEVINCPDGEIAWEYFQKKQPDICLLDINMPARDGYSLAKKIRQKNDVVPIIFLTAKSMEEDKLRGFEEGGDDYITKPFSMKELLLRMNVFLRRNKMLLSDDSREIKIGNFTFYPDEMKLMKDNENITLTQRESELLEFMCMHPNKALKREDILTHVWGKNDYFLGRSMDVFVTKLRKHLKNEPSVNIETVHNVGFRFNMPE